MDIVCLDLEGVLIPEMWIRVAEATSTDDLLVTTRDIADYDELMQFRIGVLEREGISLPDIQAITRDVEPLPGAVTFLDRLRACTQAAILSDTFIQFVAPIMERLNRPFLLCNELVTDGTGMIVDYRLRQEDGKRRAVEGFRTLNLHVQAVGDSFNDISMLRAADQGYLFRPSRKVVDANPDLPTTESHEELLELLSNGHRTPV